MNAKDRKEASRALSLIEEAKNILENLKESEQEKFDNMSESLQQTERGQAIEQAAQYLSDAFDGLETATEALGNMELN